MDSIVEKLVEIESAARSIVKHAEEEKYSIEHNLQTKRDEHDEKLESDTKDKIKSIRADAEEKMNALLDEQRAKNQSNIDFLIEDFEKNHTAYAKDVLKRIIEV
ncbi:MAG: hypothetical protein ACK5LL_15595 [Suipraeoptans sp.]